jgi:hypothetical protein
MLSKITEGNLVLLATLGTRLLTGIAHFELNYFAKYLE